MKRPILPPDSPKQPAEFAFTDETMAEARKVMARYPRGFQRSAVLPLLDLAQRQHDNWLPRAAMDYVADLLEMPRIKVYEVATFYTMYNLAPIGRFHVQVCTTTPCWLCGSDDLTKACQDKLGIDFGETSEDGLFTLSEVECLGACVNGPMVQINDDYYEDLTAERMGEILDLLAKGEPVPAGSQSGRRGSCAKDGPTTLKDKAEAAGVSMRES